jgi:DNA replication protein DnaC
MSTVKIRAGSLFRTSRTRIGATRATFGLAMRGFPTPSTGQARGSQDVHREATFPACAKAGFGCKVEREEFLVKVELSQVIKAPAEVCPLCEGTGWKTAAGGAKTGSSANDRRVTRCDCRLRARGESLLTAARIPRRYEHCELSNYDTDFPGANPSLSEAHFIATSFAKKCDPRGDKGLLIIGKIGTGKTHLAVGILKDLILSRGISCLFYDYRELLKEIQNSYNSTVQTTELDVLRPVFETDVLVLDVLGAV